MISATGQSTTPQYDCYIKPPTAAWNPERKYDVNYRAYCNRLADDRAWFAEIRQNQFFPLSSMHRGFTRQ